MLVGLILAAGAGRRFGGTKQLADLRGRPLLSYAVEAMLGAGELDRVIVVLGHAADEIRASIEFGRAEVVVAEDWDQGQSASLRRGLAEAGAVDAVVVTLGDQPFIHAGVISAALAQLGGHDAVRATYEGLSGHPVVLGPAVLAAADELHGDQGARELLDRFDVHRFEAAHLATDIDVDTQAQLRRMS